MCCGWLLYKWMWCSWMCRKLFCFRCDELEIKFNYLFAEHMFLGRVECVIYWEECSKLAMCFFESVDGLDTFDSLGNNQIGEAFLGGY